MSEWSVRVLVICCCLFKEKEKAIQKANELLQFPPVMKARQPCERTLVEDERLNPLNLTKSNYVFTDISMNVPHKVSLSFGAVWSFPSCWLTCNLFFVEENGGRPRV